MDCKTAQTHPHPLVGLSCNGGVQKSVPIHLAPEYTEGLLTPPCPIEIEVHWDMKCTGSRPS